MAGFIGSSVKVHWYTKIENIISHVMNSMKFHNFQTHTLGPISDLSDKIHDVTVLFLGPFYMFQSHLVTF